jgi:inner membrane protein COX18
MSTLLRSNRAYLRPPKPSQTLKLFLQLPPSSRSFHATPRSQFLESTLIGTHAVLEGLHSITGLPWAYTIPLAALAIRTALFLPLGIYARRATQKQMELRPLVLAWQHVYIKEAVKQGGNLEPMAATRPAAAKLLKKQQEIYARFNCGSWKHFLGFVQLPVWLVVVETIRSMCGARDGLLRWIASLFTFNAADGVGVGAAAESSQNMGSLLFDPSFATEGALWFPNLLVPDPMLALPFVLSGSILLNLSGVSGPAQSKWRRRLTNSLKVVALAIVPLTLQMPSAMLVYWTSSSLLAYGQAKLLDVMMPIKKPVVPCKLPMAIPYTKSN